MILTLIVSSAVAASEQYTCPMHPHYIAEEMGSCPICGMDLVPLAAEEVEEIDANIVQTSSKKEILYWVAPMDSNYKMDKPGKSPMGMDLVPVYAEVASSNGDNSTGRKAVTIPAETIQNMGVRTEKAQITMFGTDIRSYGLVTENVRLKKDISSRVSGWIEELNITSVGDIVQKGDLLFTLYGPELVSAQQDYLSALNSKAKGRVSSTAKRLESLGVQQKFLNDLKKTRTKKQNIPFYAESDGIVSMLMVNQGTYVKPGMQVATIQDYSSVWVNTSVAEKDLQFLSKNTKAMVIFPNIGNIERKASIDYIYPTIDASSRTGQVRLVLSNNDGSLKPGAYADVIFEANIDKRLAIPVEAILKNTEGDHVVVDLGKGRFKSKRVKVGIRTKGRAEIVSGLSVGDNVVITSQFLIDSESSLRESFNKLKNSQKSLAELEVGDEQVSMINHLIDAALYMHESLSINNNFESSYLMPALKLNDHLMPQFRGTRLQFILEGAEKAILDAQASITDNELRESLSQLLIALEPWLFEGKPDYYKSKGLNVFKDVSSERLWLQIEDKPNNPYGSGESVLKNWIEQQVLHIQNNVNPLESVYHV